MLHVHCSSTGSNCLRLTGDHFLVCRITFWCVVKAGRCLATGLHHGDSQHANQDGKITFLSKQSSRMRPMTLAPALGAGPSLGRHPTKNVIFWEHVKDSFSTASVVQIRCATRPTLSDASGAREQCLKRHATVSSERVLLCNEVMQQKSQVSTHSSD